MIFKILSEHYYLLSIFRHSIKLEVEYSLYMIQQILKKAKKVSLEKLELSVFPLQVRFLDHFHIFRLICSFAGKVHFAFLTDKINKIFNFAFTNPNI